MAPLGYELYITRREFWADAYGPEISSEEWLALIEADHDLQRAVEYGLYFASFLGDCEYGRGMGWFDWRDGSVYSKNPDKAILAKMLEIAKMLNAKVQGDGGEIYTKPDFDSGFYEPQMTAEKSGFFKSLLRAFRDLADFIQPSTNRQAFLFDTGDRVRDAVGNNGTVTEIDRSAQHGLGTITVLYDDGRVVNWSISAHGLEKLTTS